MQSDNLVNVNVRLASVIPWQCQNFIAGIIRSLCLVQLILTILGGYQQWLHMCPKIIKEHFPATASDTTSLCSHM